MNHQKTAKNVGKLVRPIVQTVCFAVFTVLFFRISYPLADDFTKNLFFNIDPLILFGLALSGSAVLAGLLLSAATIIATVVFGRAFCGWVCPMGTVFDWSARGFSGKTQSPPYGTGRFTSIKYYILAFFAAGSLLGLTIVLFLDPLVFLFRVFTLTIHPSIVFLENGVLNMLRGPLSGMGLLGLATRSHAQPAYTFALFNLILFIAAVGLIRAEKRFWCRNLCPLGALLSVISRFSLRKRVVSDACISCGKCAKVCPMNAIDGGYRETSSRECIQCERCAAVCPAGAISFGFRPQADGFTEHSPSRRGMIAAAGTGFIAALTAGASTSRKTVHGKRLRPPGAKVEDDFLDACLRCGACMKSCPTHGLQPAVTEAGFEGFFTPILTPRIGGCEEKCNDCGRVCPTGAIRNLPLVEKQYAVIGNATIEKNYCIAWEQGKLCLVCDESCPYDAIEFRMVTDNIGTIQRPFVIEDKCVGCGQCEHACPVNGRAAIYVTPINEVRKNEGSYITEKVKRLREVNDDGDSFAGTPAAGTDGAAPAQAAADSSAEEELPPGFVK